jgi:hypothetical protein
MPPEEVVGPIRVDPDHRDRPFEPMPFRPLASVKDRAGAHRRSIG